MLICFWCLQDDVKCPFDRHQQPQMVIDWLEARVKSLQGSLSSAIELNLYGLREVRELPPPVLLSNDEYFGEGKYADKKGDDSGEIDLQHMPEVVERASSVSSYEDLDEDGWVNNEDEDERVDVVDHFAIANLDTSDFRNLGAVYQGRLEETKRPQEHPITETLNTVNKYYEHAEARFAAFP